jgi:hypothetical protein
LGSSGSGTLACRRSPIKSRAPRSIGRTG